MITYNKLRFYFVIIIVIGIAYACIIAFYTHQVNYNLTALINIGERYFASEFIPKDTFYFKNVAGYDGQFYYYIAQDLLATRGIYKYIDNPVFRYQRIMHPMLVYFFALGIFGLFPFTMVLINVLSIIYSSVIVGIMLDEQHKNPWCALFYSFLSGLIFAVLKDCVEPLAMSFMVTGFYFYSKKKISLTCLFFLLASLTRETLIILIFLLFIESILLGRKWGKEKIFILYSLIPFIAWQGYLWVKFQEVPFFRIFGIFKSRSGRFALWLYINNLFQRIQHNIFFSLELLYFIIFLVVYYITLIISLQYIIKTRNLLSMAFFFFSLIPFFMSTKVWVEPLSYSRVLVPTAVLTILYFIQSKDDKNIFLIMRLHGILSLFVLGWVMHSPIKTQ